MKPLFIRSSGEKSKEGERPAERIISESCADRMNADDAIRISPADEWRLLLGKLKRASGRILLTVQYYTHTTYYVCMYSTVSECGGRKSGEPGPRFLGSPGSRWESYRTNNRFIKSLNRWTLNPEEQHHPDLNRRLDASSQIRPHALAKVYVNDSVNRNKLRYWIRSISL